MKWALEQGEYLFMYKETISYALLKLVFYLGSIWYQVPVSSCDNKFSTADLCQNFLCCVLRAAGKWTEAGK